MPINDSYDEKRVVETIANALEQYYNTLIQKMDKLDIISVIKRKNPYLYRAKAMENAAEIVESVLSAHIASSEETIFGNTFFEPIAIAVSGGQKALAEGIDIMIQKDKINTIYAIAVKSGPSVFNADSKKKQEQNFMKARVLAQQAKAIYEAFVGYGYGKKVKGVKGTPKIFKELAGKQFWTELTGDDRFYIKLIEYMGDLPEKYVAAFKTSYNKARNRLVREFSNYFCREDGSIDWEKLVEFNSGG
ncbi:MAG: cytoplasmic protein [Clostridia bacterium]|nr:cytoplasmic protein [Clostridia bacterium]